MTRSRSRFYLREVARLCEIEVRSASYELKNLEELGILLVEKEGTNKYYRVNQAHPLYEELKAIVLKTAGLGNILREKLSSLGKIDAIFIYGSVAKNIEDVTSDIDLMIIGKPNLDELDRIISKLEDRIKREISYTVFDLYEWRRKIEAKDPFVRRIVKDKKIFIVGDQSVLQET
jgi:predicted nucleotidyltransferase